MDIYNEYVQLVRLALSCQTQDVLLLAKRNTRQFSKERPELVEKLKQLITDYNTGSRSLRDNLKQPVPIDIDSKLELIRKDSAVFEIDPVWNEYVSGELNALIEERRHEKELNDIGLSPTRSALFVGPPGVGKTFAAKWLSFQLNMPLFTLDLAAVMSSFLGRTGNNIRAVLNYAQKTPSILLLDEFDAVAKRRDDESEMGELKRLVTVLLQAIDDWPSAGLLIAATNHPDLLDPAVWRRFERIIEFPYPSKEEIRRTINDLLPSEQASDLDHIVEVLAFVFEGVSFAEVVRQMNIARRESVIKKNNLTNVLEELAKKMCKGFERGKKIQLALKLLETNFSQRKVSEITGVSRDTIRKHSKDHSDSSEG